MTDRMPLPPTRVSALAGERRAPVAARAVASAVAVVGLGFFPSVLSPFDLILATQILIYAVLAISLQLLWGRAGQLSFGQAAFFGMGAYAYAIVGTRVDDAGWLYLGVAVGIPVLVAFVLGYFLFFGGVRGAYFSIVTLAFVLIANQVTISWRDVTGGDSGLTRVPSLVLSFGIFDLDFSSREAKYYLAMIVLLIGIGIALAVKWTSFGRVEANAGIECINCSVCYAACDTVAGNADYLGPAALQRAWTLLNDAKDEGRVAILDAVSGAGGCHNCHSMGSCTAYCPNELDPMSAIAGLKRETAKQFFRRGR